MRNRQLLLALILILSSTFLSASIACDIAAVAQSGQGKTRQSVAELREAAEEGNATAQYQLGVCYESGRGVPQDYAEAAKWYRKAALQGNADAQLDLASMYEDGRGVPQDYKEAAFWYFKAADQGDVYAQLDLPLRYHSQNQTVPFDLAEGAKWYRKAAEQGNAFAQYNLAEHYVFGWGVPRDYAEALKWYRKAADQGDANAQCDLGAMYEGGQGLPKDYAEAVKWYRKSAEQGNAEAQSNLGGMYYNGRGVPQNYTEALKWYRKAAEQGDAKGQWMVGFSYHDGKGVPQDFSEAAKWYLKAAEQGDTAAQVDLGFCYERGQGVPQDYVQAHMWFNLGAANSTSGDFHDLGVEGRDRVASKMTPQQIAEAQRLSRTFRPRVGPEAKADRDQSVAAPEEAARLVATGTGFFITEDGYLVTNAHVLEDGSNFKVMTAKGLLPARLVKRDLANDLAILKVEGRQSALALQSSRGVRLGQAVATVGFPNVGLQGFMPKVARGEIASLAGAQDDPRHFQISLPIQPGNSGGPLVDLRGNVVGVVVAKLDQAAALASSGALAENVNYAIKSGFLLTFLESLPAVSGHLREPSTREIIFEDVIAMVEKATVLVLVYR